MKRFVKKVLSFSILLIVIVGTLVFTTYYFCRWKFNFEIPKTKNILIVGDSHPACAINDTIFSSGLNLAQGSIGYFYTYMKVREIANRNSHIDTVVVSYSYKDLTKEMLFSERKYIASNMKNHFFLFNLEDYVSLFKVNWKEVIINTPKTILHSLKMCLIKGYTGIGHYHYSKISEVEAAKHKERVLPTISSIIYSNNESKYLLKIYDYCQKKGITLVLLNAPLHPFREAREAIYKSRYYAFAKEKMPNASVINHANFPLTDDCYMDLEHLNGKGGTKYSKFLKENRFRKSILSSE